MRSIALNSVAILFVVCFANLASGQDLSGHWSGGWESCNTGHRGKLSATFCQLDSQHVQANFRGTFAKIIPFRYRAILDVTYHDQGVMMLSGSKKLGPIMGTFQYNATIHGNSFDASYSSKRDRGVWTLRR